MKTDYGDLDQLQEEIAEYLADDEMNVSLDPTESYYLLDQVSEHNGELLLVLFAPKGYEFVFLYAGGEGSFCRL